jgi:uncharacterized membrane protein YhdT
MSKPKHFKDVRSVTLITGLLAVVSGTLGLAPLAAFFLLLTPAVLHRSWPLAGRAFVEGLAITVVGIFMSLFLVFDARGALPATCYTFPVFTIYNPVPSYIFALVSFWLVLGYAVYTGICYYRLAAIASPTADFPSKMEAALAGTFLATIIYRASWFSYTGGHGSAQGIHGGYPAYFLSHLVLALSWALGGWVVIQLIHRTVER